MLIVPIKIDWDEFKSKIKTNRDTWTKRLTEGSHDFANLDEDYEYENFEELGNELAMHLDQKFGRAIQCLTCLLSEAGEGIDLSDFCDSMDLDEVNLPAYSPDEIAAFYEQSQFCRQSDFGIQVKNAWARLPKSVLSETAFTPEQFLHNIDCWCKILAEIKQENAVLGFSIM